MITIECCQNGWIIKDSSEEYPLPVVIEIDEKDEVSSNVKLLNQIADMLCLAGSRYDKWRIHITKRHGDKWEPNKEETCKS